MADRQEPMSTREAVYLDPETERDERIIRAKINADHDHALRHQGNSHLLLGIVIGGVITMAATAFFARESGSFAKAGAAVDSQINTTTSETQGAAADAVRSVGSAARDTGNNVDQKMSDIANKTESKPN